MTTVDRMFSRVAGEMRHLADQLDAIADSQLSSDIILKMCSQMEKFATVLEATAAASRKAAERAREAGH